MSNKYPRIGHITGIPGSQKKRCEVCDEPAVAFITIEFTYMRGDDEVYKACDKHKNLAKMNTQTFIVACRFDY